MTEAVITPEEREELSTRAHELDQSIRDAIYQGRASLWLAAKFLHEFDELQGWALIGCENKTEWLADPEVNMSSTTYYRLVSVWREMAIKRKIKPEQLAVLDISKLAIVLPKLQMGKVKQREVLNDVEALGSRDLRDKYIGERRPAGPVLEDEDEDEEPEAVSGDIVEEGEEAPAPKRQVRKRGQNGAGDRGKIDREKKAIIKQALKDWEALRDELVTQAESGQANPRIDVRLIRPGVQGANLLIEQWRQDERSEDK